MQDFERERKSLEQSHRNVVSIALNNEQLFINILIVLESFMFSKVKSMESRLAEIEAQNKVCFNINCLLMCIHSVIHVCMFLLFLNTMYAL